MVVVVADGVVDAMVAEREAESQSADSLFVGLDFLKATPHTEGERRFVHFEASNDALDQEGERILKSALFADRAFYLEKGNIDLEHLTILGYRMVDPATGRSSSRTRATTRSASGSRCATPRT